MFGVLALAAISFASCCNKNCKSECENSDACKCDSCVCEPCECGCKCDPCECDPCECDKKGACDKECCGKCPVKALDEQLEAGDAAAVTASLGELAEKIETLVKEGKTEEAQKIGWAVKKFIDTNKEKLASANITVDNIVSTIATLPEAAECTVEEGVEAVKADAEVVKESAKAAADAAVEAGKAKAEEAANQAVDAAKAETNKQIDKGVDAAKKKLGL